jgi:integrase
MYDLAAAKDALSALENGDDPAVVRDALKALAVLTKSLKRRLKTPARRRKGEGALLFREDKKLYQFEVELPRAPDGKRRRRVVYGKTAEETRRKVADLKARGGGSLRPVNPARISEYVTTWLEKSERRLAPKTLEHYVWAWDKAAPIIGGMRLDRFDRSGVIGLFGALEDNGCSANTIRAVKTVMGIIIADAIADGLYTAINPFTLVKKAVPKHKAQEGRALSPQECMRFIDAARADRLEAAWLLGLTAGLRIGEIFGLQWGDLDFANAVIAVRRQAVEVKGVLHITDLKTTDSQRLVPVGNLAAEALQRRRDAASIEGESSIWVFPSGNPDMPVSPGNARRRSFAKIVSAAHIDGSLTPHDLRHAMNSIADAAGVTEKVRSERLGHADSQITKMVYTHTIDGQAREAALRIDEMLTRPTGAAD